MITKDLVVKGYDVGLIKLIISPHDDGIACQIGDNWFYSGGMTAEEYDSVEAYIADFPRETIIDEIFEALSSFKEDGDMGEIEIAEEYAYYDMYLHEQIEALVPDHVFIISTHPVWGSPFSQHVTVKLNGEQYTFIVLPSNGKKEFYYLDGKKPDFENFEAVVLSRIEKED